MRFPRNVLFQEADKFFALQGTAVMKLTASAAEEVCERAAAHGLVVIRIEGGIWHNPGFEARGDCIWDGADPPMDAATATTNNLDASCFIRAASAKHDVFIVTVLPLTENDRR